MAEEAFNLSAAGDNVPFRQILVPTQYLAIGTFLISSGFVGGLFNILGLLMFVRFPKLLWNPSAIPEVGLMLSDLCVAGLHPFSGSSALVNRWLWGPVGCQLYALSGFLFGTFQLLSVPFIAFDRFLTTCKPGWEERFRNYDVYVKIFFAIFIISIFFAVTPAAGWANYAVTPVGIACTLNWREKNTAFTSYVTVYLVVVCLAPICLSLIFYFFTISKIKGNNAPPVHWISKKRVTFTSIGCALATTLCFGGYAAVVLWAMIGDYRDIPSGISALPPAMAKIAAVINPYFYVYLHPLHWACMRKMLGYSERHEAAELFAQAEEAQTRKEIQLTARSTKSGKGLVAFKAEAADTENLVIA